MDGMKKWMLGAALGVGGLGLAGVPAQAAQFGVYIGAPAAYIPPCPGPGYTWVNGYYANGYWVQGYWNFAGDRDDYYRRFDRDRFERFDFDHEHRDFGRWRDRGWGYRRGDDGDRR
ncbi:MAG: hypothetical protein ACLGRW_17345 [Acidobacteriota bacterium]